MNCLDYLSDEKTWQTFLEYKSANQLNSVQIRELEEFIRKKEYLPVVEKIRRKESFAHPRRAQISKMGSEKKRVVYIYPREENYVLKLLTYLLIRRYDPLFPKNLYSFRAGHGVRQAVAYLTSRPEISDCYSYKADIHDYFNSVDIGLFLPILRRTLSDEPETCEFLEGLLLDPYVVSVKADSVETDGEDAYFREGSQTLITEKKGIMAGTPLASFYANLYLLEMDRWFFERGILYARYSDDVIAFARTNDEIGEYEAKIRDFLGQKNLTVNEKKETRTKPHEMWSFLGFSYLDGEIDISPVSREKLMKKMRRKMRALERWSRKKKLPRERAVKGYIRALNRKLYECRDDNELTWSRWFFPAINTTKTLEALDHYAQDCIRYLATGKRTKSRFDFRYEQMKEMGYRPLVHEYYKRTEPEDS